jgi:hypothetical protein
VTPDGSIILMGGKELDSGSSYKNDVWRSTDNGTTWTLVNASAGWTARYSHTSVVMPDRSIVLLGGYGSTGNKNDVWRSTDNGATWTLVNASAGWTAGYYHSSVVMPDGSIIIMGGYSEGGGGYKNDVWRLMTAGSSAQNPSHSYTRRGVYTVALQVFNSNGYTRAEKSGYINVGNITSKIGIFRPTSGIWSLDSNGNFAWEGSDVSLSWGLPGDIPVVGDWNGDGKDGIGIFRSSSGIWSLDSNENFAWEGSDVSLSWGLAGDIPVIGDWNGDGKDEIGIFRPGSGIWSLDSNGNYAWEGSDTSLSWGLPNDKPVVGKY